MVKSLSILYLGKDSGTSRHRADAMRRLGHIVTVLDPWKFIPSSRIFRKFAGKLVHEAGSAWLEPYTRLKLIKMLKGRHFDVIWSDQCELIGVAAAKWLRQHTDFMVAYAIDDPFGPRDKRKFSLYRKSVKIYNLIVVVRQPNVAEAYERGAQNVLLVRRSADEIAHKPIIMTDEEEANWESDVVFIGTCFPGRGSFIRKLIELDVPLTIRGNLWNRAAEWPAIKKVWRGPVVGKDYVRAIQAAKICLGLVSKGNRDLHTTRSAEVPCIGSVLCAERTEEHLCMYREGEEAVFWSTPEECAKECLSLLSDESRRKAIARAGRERCLRSGYLNEPIMKKILNTFVDRGPESAFSYLSTNRVLP